MSEVTDPRNKCFIERDECGLYASVVQQIKAMPHALANIEYIGTKKHHPDIFHSVDWAQNIVFKDGPGKDASEFHAAIFGEIAEPIHGTAISARGNHYDGREGEAFKPIDDKSKIKDVIVLRAPTLCPLDVQNLFNNQRAILKDIINVEEHKDLSEGCSPLFRSCLRSTTAEKPLFDLIAITTQKKYGVPASAGGPRVSVAVATPTKVVRVKRKFGGEDDDEDVESDSGGADVLGDKDDDASTSSIQIPSDDKIQLGAFYDPRLLEDFGGPMFKFVNGKLRQLDIRDAENKLIPPWKQYSALRPGSLIIALVSLHMYTFKSDGQDRSRDRKHFQLEAHTIKVIDESDFDVEKHLQPVPRTMLDGPSTGPSTPSTPGRHSLNNFVFTPRSSPSKPAVSKNVAGTDEDNVMDDGSVQPINNPKKKSKARK
ncbi:hypothetical protein B0H12DRAFT_1076641 [Mycena haematopus]|nr:hypothetical protein B0H12DRAFT_1076641 [Mycena haematopus]